MSNIRVSGPQPQGTVGGNVAFIHKEPRSPTQYDVQNYFLLDMWLNTVNQSVWILVSKAGTSNSRGSLAHWTQLGSGSIETLTSNSGGAVGPDGAFNINVVGDGTTITGVGNPGTHTITLSTVGSGVLSTLTANSGGAVSPLAGNINVLGDTTTINIVGNPGTHTLTASTTGIVATSYHTDNGIAVPAAGVIIFDAVTQAGSSVSFSGAGNTVSLNTTDGGGNVIIGLNAGNNTLTGTGDVGLGFTALHNITTGSNNTAVGDLVATTLTTGSSNVAIGKSALAITTGSNNIAIGTSAGSATTTSESSNIYVGNVGVITESNVMRLGTNGTSGGQQNTTYIAGNVHLPQSLFMDQVNVSNQGIAKISFAPAALAQPTCDIYFWLNNIFIGQSAGNQTMTPSVALFNTGIGHFSCSSITTGAQNDCVGNGTLQNGTTANNNIAIGYTTMSSATTADHNVAIGSGAFQQNLTGSNNIMIGQMTGLPLTGAESGNIFIGSALHGVVGDNNTIRMGYTNSASSITRTFIDGIRGITTTNNDAVAVLVDSAGQLGTVSSSVRYKENIKDMGSTSDDIYKLRPVTFNYKKHAPQDKSVGLIAEEVAAILPNLVIYNKEGQPETVKYHDLPVLLLNEIIKLRKEIDQLKQGY